MHRRRRLAMVAVVFQVHPPWSVRLQDSLMLIRSLAKGSKRPNVSPSLTRKTSEEFVSALSLWKTYPSHVLSKIGTVTQTGREIYWRSGPGRTQATMPVLKA